MFVKICGITNEDDALLAVAMGADAVGFIFAPGRRARSPRRSPTTSPDGCHPRSSPSGCSATSCPTRVVELAHKSGVKAVQLHGRETAEQCIEVAKQIRWVIKAFSAGDPNLPRADRYGTDMMLLDGAEPGSGKVFDWSLAGDAPDSVRLILAGGLTPTTSPPRSRRCEPWGVDVCERRRELSRASKDALAVKRFIENARAAAPVPYLGDDDAMPYDWDIE